MAKAALKRALQGAAIAILIVLVIGLYKAKSDAAKAEAHVRALERAIAEHESDLRALRAEIAQLESPARVEAMAQERLGLRAGAASAALPESAMEATLPAARRAETRAP